ncbi:TMV resistance protein N-like [Dorcoceras hygrometricum]|uniref:TMV resistance protein N-like n=1 Tax=Dorcoceras hygrometricum TaxID=472368 RepID=A0A2Z7AXN5_9LAMI|nr:TMV resistance protein N-like [Dorcoceras hygrometricum]
MACAMIKAAGSHSYIESAVARFQQAYYLKITSRSVVELEKKPAATQIQQRRKFSSDANSEATHQSCIYVYLLCSNGIPYLLSVSPNTHPLLLHPDKNEEQVEEEEQDQFWGW